MTDNTRAAIAITIDIAIWVLAIWLMVVPKDSTSRAQMYWYAAKVCQACAVWFGNRGLEAELLYYAEVQL